MNYLTSERFNAKTMMGSLPIQHYLNKAIDDHLKGIGRSALKVDKHTAC